MGYSIAAVRSEPASSRGLPGEGRSAPLWLVRESGPEGGYPGASSAPAAAHAADPFEDADGLEELEHEIVVLASHIHAATHRFLTLIADFDRREGWKLAGHRNCADWLHFRTGIDRGAAREKVRTARALEKLPLTGEAMARGELSFSKVRAITRLVDDLAAPGKGEAETGAEAEVLSYARECTTAELEKLVRGWSLVSRLEEGELERRRHRSRYLSIAPDGDGMYVIRGKVDPEVGALLMRAVEAASDALFREGKDWAPEGGTRGPATEEVTPRQRRADAVGLLAMRAMAAGFGGDSEEAAADGARECAGPAPLSGTRAERYQVVLHTETSTLEEEGEVARSHLEDGARVSAETSRRLTCDASVVEVKRGADGSVLDVGRRTRTIPPALRRALEIRDSGCRFPGCGVRFTDAHHIVHWADGGETALSNLILLCGHHHRALHEEGFRVQAREVGTFQFFDRTGWPLPNHAPVVSGVFAPFGRRSAVGGDSAVEVGTAVAGGSTVGAGFERGAVARLIEENRRLGADPDAFTLSATWKSEADIPWERQAPAWEALDRS